MRKWHRSAHGGSGMARVLAVGLLVVASTLVASSCASEQNDAANRGLTANGGPRQPNDAATDRSRTTSGGPKQPNDAGCDGCRMENPDAGCFPLLYSLISGRVPPAEAATCACALEPSANGLGGTWQDAVAHAHAFASSGNGCAQGSCEALGHCGRYDAVYIQGVDNTMLVFYDPASGKAVARLQDLPIFNNTCSTADESFAIPTGHCIWNDVPDGQGPIPPPTFVDAQTPSDPCTGNHPAGGGKMIFGCPCTWPDRAWCCVNYGDGMYCDGGVWGSFSDSPCGPFEASASVFPSLPRCDPCADNDPDGWDRVIVGCACRSRDTFTRCCDGQGDVRPVCVNSVWTLEIDSICSEVPEGAPPPSRVSVPCARQHVSNPPYSTEPW